MIKFYNLSKFCFLILVLVPALNSIAQAPSYEWSLALGSASNDYSNEVRVDGNGFVYVVGYFSGTIDFDPGVGTWNMTSAGARDIYVSKSTSAGNLVWAIRMGSTSDDEGASVAINSSGEVYVTGAFRNTADFNPGAGINALTSNGNQDVFVAKYDASGGYIWAKSFGGSGADYGKTLDLDNSGNPVHGGYFSTTVDFDPNAGVNSVSVSGTYDCYFSKWDANGNLAWVNTIGSPGDDMVYALQAKTNSGDIVVSGYYAGLCDMDPGAASLMVNTAGSGDCFASRFDSNGNLIWANCFGGTAFDAAHCIRMDAGGNTYASGAFRNTTDMNPGAGILNFTSLGIIDGFITKFDPAGNFLWSKQYGTPDHDNVVGLSFDNSGNIIGSGIFSGTIDADPGAGSLLFNQFGGGDMFVTILNPSGDHIWAGQFGGTGWEVGRSNICDQSGNIYITGEFENTADFDPGVGVANEISAGNWDAYLVKLITCPTCSSISITACSDYTVPSGDETYTTSGIYMDTIPAAGGGDSLITINLTILNPTSTMSVVVCNNYTVPSGDETYFSSGIYTDTLTSFLGCDSIITINLTVNQTTTSSINETSCDAYTVPSGTTTYSTSGVYMDTLTNAAGCDSIITINLTITNSTTALLTETACDTYTVPSGINTYASSGIYMDTLTNAVGCDSIITIDLTVNYSSSSFITIEACRFYTVPSGDTTYYESGTFTDIIINSVGCDSIISIDLTIGDVDATIVQVYDSLLVIQPAPNYQWILCATGLPIAGATNQYYIPPFDGFYAVIVSDDGCVDTSACTAVVGVGYDESGSNMSLDVYPNPSPGNITVVFDTDDFVQTRFQLIALTGQVVFESDLVSSQQSIELKGVASGTYLMRFSTEQVEIYRRLILE